MSLYSLILRRRSIRRFKQRKVRLALLKKFVNAARLAPSAGNLQPLEYIIINTKDTCDRVFQTLKWAGYLRNGSPKEGERPTAYIVLLLNKKINKRAAWDAGAAGENILLTALEHKIGGCVIGSIDRSKLMKILGIPTNYAINTVIALGYPAERAIVVKAKRAIKYWRRGKFHFVPKRELSKILHINKF